MRLCPLLLFVYPMNRVVLFAGWDSGPAFVMIMVLASNEVLMLNWHYRTVRIGNVICVETSAAEVWWWPQQFLGACAVARQVHCLDL
jgi:hypothetical protein